MKKLNQVLNYIRKCSFDDLRVVHKESAERFHQLKYADEIEKRERMKRNLSVGDRVSWASDKTRKRGKDRIHGIVIRVNPKTATIATKEDGEWRVGYGFLRKEGSYKNEPKPRQTWQEQDEVVEGEIVMEKDEGEDPLDIINRLKKMGLLQSASQQVPQASGKKKAKKKKKKKRTKKKKRNQGK